MTIEAKKWFEAQRFRMERLKGEGKDLGTERRNFNEQVLFEAADKRIDKYFEERRRSGKADSR